MNKKERKILFWMAICAAILSLAMVVHIVVVSGTAEREKDLVRLQFNGTYQTDSMDESMPIDSKTNQKTKKAASVCYVGHFNRDIPEGVTIMFLLNNVKASFYVDDKLIEKVGSNATGHSILNMSGWGWDTMKSKGISKKDEVSVLLSPHYSNIESQPLGSFMENIYMGNTMTLLIKELPRDYFRIPFGMGIAFLGFLLLLGLVIMRFIKTAAGRQSFWLAVFMTTGGFWVVSTSSLLTLMIDVGSVVNTCFFLNQNLMLISFLLYVNRYLLNRYQIVIAIGLGLEFVHLIAYTILYFSGITWSTQLSVFFLGLTVGCVVAVFICMFLQLKNQNDKDARFVMHSIVIAAVGFLVDSTNSVLGFSEAFVGFQLALIAILIMHGIRSVRSINIKIQRARNMQKLENQLMENSIQMMIGQIQPHFLFNSLTAIQQLCVLNPTKAEIAISDFAAYLRGNIDTLRSTSLVSFDREMMQIKHYINLEKMRFEDRVNIAYDIETTDFMVPSLSVQSLVENAVRHGITKKPEGGTVTIIVKRVEKGISIVLIDDGISIERSMEKKKDAHLKLNDVKKRIEQQCNGTLTLVNREGDGNVVRLFFPDMEQER